MQSAIPAARHPRHNLAPRQPRRNLLPNFRAVGILQQVPGGIKHQRIPALQNRQRRKRFQPCGQALDSRPLQQQNVSHHPRQRGHSSAQSHPHVPEDRRQIKVPHRRRRRFPAPPHLVQQAALSALHAISQIVQLLLPLPNRSHDPAESPVLRQFRQSLSAHQQPVTQRAFQPLLQRRGLILHSLPRPDHQLRRRRRGRSPQVGNEIHNREIRFVPHRRNHWNLRSRHRPRQRLIIERRQIFRRPSAARYHNHFHTSLAIEVPPPRRHFLRRRFALHLRRINHHIHGVMSPLQYVQNVAQRRRLRRSHNPHPRRKRRQRLLSLRREQPFGFQLGLQLLKRNLQRPRTLGFDRLRRNLQLTAFFIHRHPPAHHHLHSVGGTKPQQLRRRSEHHHANLRAPILQREVKMPRIRRSEIRNFSLPPRIRILPLQMRPHRGHEIAHRPHSPFGRTKAEPHLIRKRRHPAQCIALPRRDDPVSEVVGFRPPCASSWRIILAGSSLPLHPCPTRPRASRLQTVFATSRPTMPAVT